MLSTRVQALFRTVSFFHCPIPRLSSPVSAEGQVRPLGLFGDVEQCALPISPIVILVMSAALMRLKQQYGSEAVLTASSRREEKEQCSAGVLFVKAQGAH